MHKQNSSAAPHKLATLATHPAISFVFVSNAASFGSYFAKLLPVRLNELCQSCKLVVPKVLEGRVRTLPVKHPLPFSPFRPLLDDLASLENNVARSPSSISTARKPVLLHLFEILDNSLVSGSNGERSKVKFFSLVVVIQDALVKERKVEESRGALGVRNDGPVEEALLSDLKLLQVWVAKAGSLQQLSRLFEDLMDERGKGEKREKGQKEELASSHLLAALNAKLPSLAHLGLGVVNGSQREHGVSAR